MDSIEPEQFSSKNLVAVPYPGRGHVNPMINVCNLLAAKGLHITFVVTEEWLGFISSGGSSPALSSNITVRSIPNVIPSELNRAADFSGFLEAVGTKMGTPFEQLLDQLEMPASIIIADIFLPWAIEIANRRNIPIALLCPVAPSTLSILLHFNVIVSRCDFLVDMSEVGEDRLDYVLGIPSIRMSNLPLEGGKIPGSAIEAAANIHKAQWLLFTTFYELEVKAIDSLRTHLPFQCYPIGPSIPFTSLHEFPSNSDMIYFDWLNSQPKSSVMYVSFGSFLSVSVAQMDEIIAGLGVSRVRFLMVARNESLHLQRTYGEMGLVVPWCKQLCTLCHPSVGGFLTHCGWNSTMEGIFAGVPMLTLPITFDQMTNSKLIVEDWKVGLSLRSQVGVGSLVERGEVAEVVGRLMDLDGEDGKQMRRRANLLKEACRGVVEKSGSSSTNLDAFVRDFVTGHGH